MIFYLFLNQGGGKMVVESFKNIILILDLLAIDKFLAILNFLKLGNFMIFMAKNVILCDQILQIQPVKKSRVVSLTLPPPLMWVVYHNFPFRLAPRDCYDISDVIQGIFNKFYYFPPKNLITLVNGNQFYIIFEPIFLRPIKLKCHTKVTAMHTL